MYSTFDLRFSYKILEINVYFVIKRIKFPRKCPSLNPVICSTCCGIKKGLEIKCIDDCKYFIENHIKENNRPSYSPF
jgi:hypothetical protein